jgi:hypothetical protein
MVLSTGLLIWGEDLRDLRAQSTRAFDAVCLGHQKTINKIRRGKKKIQGRRCYDTNASRLVGLKEVKIRVEETPVS